MSRSYRKYYGLNHTWSDTKQGKAAKKISHRRTRAKAKASEDGVELRTVENTMEDYFLKYSMSVIIDRAVFISRNSRATLPAFAA